MKQKYFHNILDLNQYALINNILYSSPRAAFQDLNLGRITYPTEGNIYLKIIMLEPESTLYIYIPAHV